MHKVDENRLPNNHLLISVGEGPIFQYTSCGLDYVYVRGMVEVHPTMDGWLRLKELSQVNNQIADHILAQTILSAAHFRFLQKETGLSLARLCAELGLDVEFVDAWEAGSGFAPSGAEGVRDIYGQYRELGYVKFLQTHSAQVRAA